MSNMEIIAGVAESIGYEYDGDNLKTFQEWKKLGYTVKKGEKAFLKVDIWRKGKPKKTEEGEEKEGNFYKKLSHFFTPSQVEKI